LKEFYFNYIKEFEFVAKYLDGSFYKAQFEVDIKKLQDKQSIDFIKEETAKRKK
jgi:hypothetical protein